MCKAIVDAKRLSFGGQIAVQIYCMQMGLLLDFAAESAMVLTSAYGETTVLPITLVKILSI